MSDTAHEATSSRIATLARSIQGLLGESVKSIVAIDSELHLLAFNAKLQAAKAGQAGAGFAVVASEIKELVGKTQAVTADMDANVGKMVGDLMQLNALLETNVRGKRLVQVAANCIDLIDRNLYERSCDVRWWATESAVVDALQKGSPEHLTHASSRLATILQSYTVYFDIVLCDASGNLVCNGRPREYSCVGASCASADWFQQAMRGRDGTEFGFEGPMTSVLAGGKPALVYSCGVRKDGNTHGALVGAIGVVFNWDSLCHQILRTATTMLDAETEHQVQLMLCSPQGTVISALNPGSIGKPVPVQDLQMLLDKADGFLLEESVQGRRLLGKALSMGYETYRTGWMVVVMEDQGR